MLGDSLNQSGGFALVFYTLFPLFVVYFISGAETNRLPFDVVEGELSCS